MTRRVAPHCTGHACHAMARERDALCGAIVICKRRDVTEAPPRHSQIHTYADMQTLDFAQAHAIVDNGRDS